MKKIGPSDAYYNDYIKVLGLVVAVLRRFAASNVHRAQTVQLFYNYLVVIPRHYINDLNNQKANPYFSFLFKEISGLMGVLSLDSKFLKRNMHD